MQGTMRALGWLIVGVALGHAVPVQAQTPTLKWADLVGTWEEVLDAGTVKDSTLRNPYDRTPVYRSVTFRPDTTALWTRIGAEKGDTIACSSKTSGISTDPNAKVRVLFPIGDTIWALAGERAVVHLQDQQLSLKDLHPIGPQQWREGKTSVFRRGDPSHRRYGRVIAAGFVLGRPPLPAHPQPPTGTLADLVGAWERLPDSELAQMRVIRWISIHRSDSTGYGVVTQQVGEDTVACTTPLSWGEGWKRQPGDSIINNKIAQWKMVLRDQQLSVYQNSNDKKPTVYKAIELPKQP